MTRIAHDRLTVNAHDAHDPVIGSSAGGGRRYARATADGIALELANAIMKDEDAEHALALACRKMGRLIGHGLTDRSYAADRIHDASPLLALRIGDDAVQAIMVTEFAAGEEAAAEEQKEEEEREAADRAAEEARKAEEEARRLLPPPSNPMSCAREFVAARFNHELMPLLKEQGGQFYRWDGTCWPTFDDRDVRNAAYEFTENARCVDDEGKAVRWSPTRRKIADFVEALRAVTAIPTDTPAPSWLCEEGDPASEFIACANGIVHIPTRTLRAHTPAFYVHHSLPYTFLPDAPAPAAWLAFLDDLWGGDPEAISCLQEIVGYLIAGDTRQQKMFLIVGPRRSGKGTIARVLKALIGAHNTAGPTLSSIGTNFGLSPLIGKPVAIVSDARLGGNDTSVVAERLLSISGEDTLTIDRKYREPVTMQLPTRFIVFTNELPRLADASGALASRFITLTMQRSFYGSEDTGLTQKLLAELPGILNWGLDGAERLNGRGRFLEPASSADARREMEDLGSPINAFVRDRCVVGPEHEVVVDAIYGEWKAWCADNGRHATSAQVFGRDLRAAFPGIKVVKPRGDDGRQHRTYQGIGKAG